MKKIFIAMMMAVALAGCVSSSKAKDDHAVLETVYHNWSDFMIIRDKETGQEYICYHTANGVAITPRLTKDCAD